jgi:hypothetical protein
VVDADDRHLEALQNFLDSLEGIQAPFISIVKDGEMLGDFALHILHQFFPISLLLQTPLADVIFTCYMQILPYFSPNPWSSSPLPPCKTLR